MSKSNKFSETPLITAERIAADPAEAFAIVPEWAEEKEIIGDRMFFVAGKKHPKAIHMPLPESALCCELGRFGITIVTNTNGRSDSVVARYYVKFAIPGAAKSNMPIRRVFSGAAEAIETKALEIESDYSVTNIAFAADPGSKWDARTVILREARRLASQHAPKGFDVDAYIANIKRLFTEIDLSLGRNAEATE